MKKKILGERYEALSLKVRLLLFFIDIIGTLLFLPLKMVKHKTEKYTPKNVTNILILRLDGLGDLVISTAALREIRQGFPNAKITLVVGSWSKGLAECISYYDRLIVHDFILFSFFRGNRKIYFGRNLEFIRKLRSAKFDLGIDLRGDLLSIIPLFLSGTKFRFAKATRGGGFLLTHTVQWSKDDILHEKDKALRLPEDLGVVIKNRDMELLLCKEDQKCIEEYLAGKGIDRCELIVTIAPRALYVWRSWRPERFAEVVSAISQRYEIRIVLVGSRKDRSILDQIDELSGFKTVNSAGDLTLSQVVALIDRSMVFIGNDSGLIHIAAAVKTPLIQLFGPGEDQKFGYTDGKNILLMKNDCPYHPCTQRRCTYQQKWCMDQISVEDVLKAFRKMRL